MDYGYCMSYKCTVCSNEEKFMDKWHKLGRERLCLACGRIEVVVRRVEVKNNEPGKGKIRMTKKERRTFRAYAIEKLGKDSPMLDYVR